MNNPHYLHMEEKQEGETFFDVMNRLIARSKAVTADMEAVLAELESEIDPIQYADINTSYWQSHFYAFGRPPYN